MCSTSTDFHKLFLRLLPHAPPHLRHIPRLRIATPSDCGATLLIVFVSMYTFSFLALDCSSSPQMHFPSMRRHVDENLKPLLF